MKSCFYWDLFLEVELESLTLVLRQNYMILVKERMNRYNTLYLNLETHFQFWTARHCTILGTALPQQVTYL